MVKTGKTSITVKWQHIPEGSRNGVLVGYKIKYKKLDGGEIMYLTTDSQIKSQAKITNLERGSAYEIKVAGYTGAGTGPYSDAETQSTKYCKLFRINVYIENSVQFFTRHLNATAQ